jgi:hypothetical protein
MARHPAYHPELLAIVLLDRFLDHPNRPLLELGRIPLHRWDASLASGSVLQDLESPPKPGRFNLARKPRMAYLQTDQLTRAAELQKIYALDG